MPFNRTSSRVAIGLLAILLAAPCLGQGPEGMQLFEHADCSTMGGDIAPNEGWFLQFDALYWTVSQPNVTQVGFPNLTRQVFFGPVTDDGIVSDEGTQRNTLDTSPFHDQFSIGARYEFGRIEDRNGWFMSIYQIRDQEQDFTVSKADIVFQDDPAGPLGLPHLAGVPQGQIFTELLPLPVTIYNISMNHTINTWGVEAMYLHRFRTCHEGSTFELFAGPRYLEFNDRFDFIGGVSLDPNAHDFLSGSTWTSRAENHIIGGELGGRWFKKQGRWTLSTEGRFLAAMNQQNIHQQVNFGPNLLNNSSPFRRIPNPPEFGNLYQPWILSPTESTYEDSPQVFTPGVELRLEARYQVTRYLSFHAGWTGLWLGGIARGDSTIDYTLHTDNQVFGIDTTRNRENVLMNGLTMGFDFNR
jgi:hypothetical protein